MESYVVSLGAGMLAGVAAVAPVRHWLGF
ncbi:XapX domain protein [Burkholderia cepacia]